MSVARLARTFFTGLAVVLPIFITAAVILWLINAIESTLGGVVKLVLPEGSYQRGLGLLLALGLVFAIGVLMEAVYFQRIVAWFEELLNRIPLVKTIYSAMRDLMSLFSGDDKRKFSKVVMVQWPNFPGRLIGFITVEDFSQLPMKPGSDVVAVYMPMSYQIGGYTMFLPRNCLTPLDMTLEEAMRFVVTAGMSRPG